MKMERDEIYLHRAVTTVHVPKKIWDVHRKIFKILVKGGDKTGYF